MACVLLAICVLMQSAVNTFNDYYDYVKGADSADDNVDPTDAVLVYNNVNPRAALALAVGFLAAAFSAGGVCDLDCGLDPPRHRRAWAPSSSCCTRRARRPSRTCPSASWSAGSSWAGSSRLRATRRFRARSTSGRFCGPCPRSWAWGSSCSRTTRATWRRTWNRDAARCPCCWDASGRAGCITGGARVGRRHRRARGRVLHEGASGGAVHAAGSLAPAERAAEEPAGAARPRRRHGAGVQRERALGAFYAAAILASGTVLAV